LNNTSQSKELADALEPLALAALLEDSLSDEGADHGANIGLCDACGTRKGRLREILISGL